MLFDSGNPYNHGLPQVIKLSEDDFFCDISSINLKATECIAKWTVLVYMGANNNLAADMFEDLLEMKEIGSSEDLNIVVFFIGPLLTDTFFARLNKGTPLSQDMIYRWYTASAKDPKVLKAAIGLTFSFYPAENNLLIISGHGNGWKGALQDDGIGRRYEEQGKVSKPPKDIAATIKECHDSISSRVLGAKEPGNRPKPKFDILAFDACYMGSAEVLSCFRDISNIIISSEDRLPCSGYPYNKILGIIRDDPTKGYKELAKQMVLEVGNYYKTYGGQYSSNITLTQVVIDSSKSSLFYNAVNDFAKNLIIYMSEQEDGAILIKECADNAFHFGKGNIDLNGLALSIMDQDVPASLKVSASSLQDSFEKSGFIIESTAIGGSDMPNGISIYFPDPDKFEPNYLDVVKESDLNVWPWLLGMYSLSLLRADALKSPLIESIKSKMIELVEKGEYRPD